MEQQEGQCSGMGESEGAEVGGAWGLQDLPG